MKREGILICLSFFSVVVCAGAGLFSPAVVNPSFETDILDAGTKSTAITDWWNRTSYCFVSEETNTGFPLTPSGQNWAEFGNRSWVYQQIGTWEPGMMLEVSLLVGSVSGRDFPGLYVSLWVGGEPASAADSGTANPTTLESAVGATQVAISELIQPALTGAATVEVQVTLSSGSAGTEGEPLWLLLQSAGLGRVLIDAIAVRRLPVSPVTPAHGQGLVPITTELQWEFTEGYTITACDVYLGTDPNEAAPGGGLVKIVDRQLVTQVDPAPSAYTAAEVLEYGTTYYWRVDVYEPNAPGPDVRTEGPLWRFETVPREPQIVTDPVGQVVAAGQSVSFTVETANADTFAWYKEGVETPLSDGDRISGSATPVLTIRDVGLADEGFYYCVASNALTTAEAVSASAQLMIERLVGWWKLDGTLEDSVDEAVPGAPPHDGVVNDPNFVDDGFDGGAYEFFGDRRVITIAGSETVFNFYPSGVTVNAWVKLAAPRAFATVVAKRNEEQTAGWMLRCPDAAAFTVEQASQETAMGQSSVADGQWHMLTGRFDGSMVEVYVDGVRAGSAGPNSNTIGVHAEPLIFGAARPSGAGTLEGLVDDIRIWNYALSPEAIAKLYANATGSGVCMELPAYDFNGDCVVNLSDFAALAETWMESHIVSPE